MWNWKAREIGHSKSCAFVGKPTFHLHTFLNRDDQALEKTNEFGMAHLRRGDPSRIDNDSTGVFGECTSMGEETGSSVWLLVARNSKTHCRTF